MAESSQFHAIPDVRSPVQRTSETLQGSTVLLLQLLSGANGFLDFFGPWHPVSTNKHNNGDWECLQKLPYECLTDPLASGLALCDQNRQEKDNCFSHFRLIMAKHMVFQCVSHQKRMVFAVDSPEFFNTSSNFQVFWFCITRYMFRMCFFSTTNEKGRRHLAFDEAIAVFGLEALQDSRITW